MYHIRPAFLLSLALAGGPFLASTASAQCPTDDAFAPNFSIGNPTESNASPRGVMFEDLVILPVGDPNLGQDDVFRFELEAGETVVARAEFTTSTPDAFLQVLDFNNAALLQVGAGAGSTIELSWTNNTGAADEFALDVQNESPTVCYDYDLFIRRTFCPADDPFPGTVDCFSTNDLFSAGGFIPSLALQSGSDDYFEIGLAPGNTLTVALEFEHDDGDIDLEFVDRSSGSCGTTLLASTSTSDMESLSYTNASNAPLAIVVRAYLFNGACNGYSMTWSTAFGDPCLLPDEFEPNDTICSTAFAPDVGVYEDLTLTSASPDFMDLGLLSPGGRYTVSADFVHADGDIDLRLWDTTAGCANAVLISSSTSVGDFEQLSFENTGVSQVALVAEIYLFSGDCNTYTWTEAAGQIDGLGDVYCSGTTNSTGLRGLTVVDGDPVAANNAVVLRARQVPPLQFGIFVTSQGTDSVFIPGSMGRLCLGGTLGRFQGPGQIVQIDAAGETSLGIDLTALPAGGVAVPAAAGETWYFQFWHRDFVGGQTSNLASATRVRWQ